MITYKNKILTIQKSVDSADTIITLATDIEATYLGNITLSNKQKKILSFVNILINKDTIESALILYPFGYNLINNNKNYTR
jgi:mannose/fructose/N-acetylgalactosamine-specific phosphotransferase system component IIB